MPWSNNSDGPWGGGKSGGKGSGDRGPWGGGGGGGSGGGQGPDVDEILRQGRDRLKVIFGGGGGGGARKGGGGDGIGRGGYALIALAVVGAWAYASFYSVKPEERSVELFLGEEYAIGEPGLNFAPWPVVKAEVLPVRVERTVDIGTSGRTNDRGGGIRPDEGLMLTGDENIVDIEFQVVWNVDDPAKFLFNIADPDQTIRAVSESAMREVIAKSELKPILNRDRAIVSDEVRELIQSTLDSYESGVAIVRVNFDRADPPGEVIDAFRDVQAAAQERDTFEKQAEAYANQRLAGARGEAAQLLQEAEAYRARVVNEAQGEASRFKAIYEEYADAQEVTRKRLYLETLERVLGRVDKVILDESAADAGQGVVPYLPLNELRRGATQ